MERRVFSSTKRPSETLDELLALVGQRIDTLGELETWARTEREEPLDIDLIMAMGVERRES
jgi:hypothetical protein